MAASPQLLWQGPAPSSCARCAVEHDGSPALLRIWQSADGLEVETICSACVIEEFCDTDRDRCSDAPTFCTRCGRELGNLYFMTKDAYEEESDDGISTAPLCLPCGQSASEPCVAADSGAPRGRRRGSRAGSATRAHRSALAPAAVAPALAAAAPSAAAPPGSTPPTSARATLPETPPPPLHDSFREPAYEHPEHGNVSTANTANTAYGPYDPEHCNATGLNDLKPFADPFADAHGFTAYNATGPSNLKPFAAPPADAHGFTAYSTNGPSDQKPCTDLLSDVHDFTASASVQSASASSASSNRRRRRAR